MKSKFSLLLCALLTLLSFTFFSCQNQLDTSLNEADPNYDSSIDSKMTAEKEFDPSYFTSSGSKALALSASPLVIKGQNGFTSSISDTSTDVEVGKPLVLTFSSIVDAQSVNASTLGLSELTRKANTPVNIRYRAIISGNTVTIIPQLKLLPLSVITVSVNGITAGGTSASGSVSYTQSDIDYGLYFWGKEGVCEKYTPGIANAFYNTSKPTVLFAHGWQPSKVGKTDLYGRFGMEYEAFYWAEDNFDGQTKYNGQKKWTNTGFIDKGWNTAMVYWTQFADEPAASSGNLFGVHAAEAKIWSFSGPQGSRYAALDANNNRIYKNFSGNIQFKGQSVHVNSAGEMLSLYVVDALKQSNANLRMTGHSLGNQMTTYLAYSLFKAGVKVNRVALLDPAWTADAKDYLANDGFGTWTGERTRNYLFAMQKANPALAIEIYHSTALNLGLGVNDNNTPLTSVVCDSDMAPWYYSGTNLGAKHGSIRHSYFWSFESNPPLECTISWWQRKLTGAQAASAATSDARILQMMKSSYRWVQVEGRYTPNPSDDWFDRKSK